MTSDESQFDPNGVAVRSPGKLFLVGEYAVLFGAPAIVKAVDRYVTVSVHPATSSDTIALELISRGADLPKLQARWQANTLSYLQATPEHQLVITLLSQLCEQGVLQPSVGPLRIVVDSRDLFHQNQKLGLGSSAAVSHGLVEAVLQYARNTTGQRHSLPERFVFDAHRSFQNGKGSGADLGAGMVGGTYRYRRQGDEFELSSVAVPEDLKQTAVWVGQSASTADALTSLATFRAQYRGSFDRALHPLVELSRQAADAICAGHSRSFVEYCDAYGHNLSEFGRTVGLNIVSEAHRNLRKIATEVGVAYKPSGAGNGDLGSAFSLDIKALERFEIGAEEAGYTPLQLAQGKPCHRI